MQNLKSSKTVNGGLPQFPARRNVDHLRLVPGRTPRYKLAIFDFDGTLADSLAWFLGVLNEVADDYNFRRLKEQELAELRSLEARQILEYVGISRWKLPLLQRHVRKRMTSEIRHIALFPGIAGLLQRLRYEGIALAIVTSNSLLNVREVLGRQNACLIQHYACGAPILGKRPRLRKVLHSSGVHASEAIFIGDEIRDLHAARAEGIAFGAVSWGVNSVESLTERFPEEMFCSIDEIAERVVRPWVG